MSTLVMNSRIRDTQPGKTALVYVVLSFAAIAVDNIYALFGHGVRSAAMTWMFLYPLLGGTPLYFFLWLLVPDIAGQPLYRPGYNLHNSGIATLTCGSFLTGVVEIAGTASPYIRYITAAGWALAGAGLLLLLMAGFKINIQYVVEKK